MKSQHLPYVKLPPEINLADPADYNSWYSKVSFSIPNKDGKTIAATPEPLVFYAAALTDAPHPREAAQFIDFLKSPAGQQFFSDSGYDSPLGRSLP